MITRFLHYLGFAAWMGAGWATMALVIRSRRDNMETRMGLFRILPAAFSVMAAGAVVTVLSGIGLAVMLVRLGFSARLSEPGIIVMQGCGIIAAVVVLAIGVPTARKLSRLAEADIIPPEFERYRRRLAMAASVGGMLGVLALVGATLV